MQESGPNGFDDSMHCVTPAVPLLPALLKAEGFATHALGKWDVGYVQRHCLPTTRGFDTFLVRTLNGRRALCPPSPYLPTTSAAADGPRPIPLLSVSADPLAPLCGQGYYTPCTSDYWYHGAPGGGLAKSKCGGVDFHDSVLEEIKPAAMSGPASLNGTCASRSRSATGPLHFKSNHSSASVCRRPGGLFAAGGGADPRARPGERAVLLLPGLPQCPRRMHRGSLRGRPRRADGHGRPV